MGIAPAVGFDEPVDELLVGRGDVVAVVFDAERPAALDEVLKSLAEDPRRHLDVEKVGFSFRPGAEVAATAAGGAAARVTARHDQPLARSEAR